MVSPQWGMSIVFLRHCLSLLVVCTAPLRLLGCLSLCCPKAFTWPGFFHGLRLFVQEGKATIQGTLNSHPLNMTSRNWSGEATTSSTTQSPLPSSAKMPDVDTFRAALSFFCAWVQLGEGLALCPTCGAHPSVLVMDGNAKAVTSTKYLCAPMQSTRASEVASFREEHKELVCFSSCSFFRCRCCLHQVVYF